MKKLGVLMLFLVCMGIAPAGFAEFYKYVDEEGKVQFTDNIANIPDDQREKIEAYKEAKSSPPGASQSEKEERSADTAEAGETAQGGDRITENESVDMQADLLEKRGEALQQEYEALMEEREALDQAAKVRLTPARKRKLVEEISDFNLRIKAYEKKRQEYNEAVEAYNTGVAEGTTKSDNGLSGE
jgi:hypothetical protein